MELPASPSWTCAFLVGMASGGELADLYIPLPFPFSLQQVD